MYYFSFFMGKIANGCLYVNEVKQLPYLLIIAMLIFLIVLIPLYIDASFKMIDKDNKFKIKLIALGGLVKYTIIDSKQLDEKRIEKKEKNISKENKAKKLYESYGRDKYFTKGVIYYLWRKIKIKKINWNTRLGMEDAAVLGIMTGVLWSIKGVIIGFILNNKIVEDLYVDVVPVYNTNNIEISFNCIIKVKIVYIITASFYGLKTKIKGGES